MSTDDRTSSLAFPSAAALDATLAAEPRGGPDAALQRYAQAAAVAALNAPLPSVEEQERAKRVRVKLDYYYGLRSQRMNEAARGALEGAAVALGLKLVLGLFASSGSR
jgi:hypothetical protein